MFTHITHNHFVAHEKRKSEFLIYYETPKNSEITKKKKKKENTFSRHRI